MRQQITRKRARVDGVISWNASHLVGEAVVMKLADEWLNSGRNITFDNWFTTTHSWLTDSWPNKPPSLEPSVEAIVQFLCRFFDYREKQERFHSLFFRRKSPLLFLGQEKCSCSCAFHNAYISRSSRT